MKPLREFQAQDQLPERVWLPSELQLRQYAEASGDYNPIHLDNRFALQAGLGGVIAHGMLSMAQIGVMLTDWLKDEGVLKRFEVRFKGMVRPGNRIVCSGKVREINSTCMVCDVYATNDSGTEVISGSVEISFRP